MLQYLTHSKHTCDVYFKYTGDNFDKMINRLLHGNYTELSQTAIDIFAEYTDNSNMNYSKFYKIGGDLELTWKGEHAFDILKKHNVSEEIIESLLEIVLEKDPSLIANHERKRIETYIRFLDEVANIVSDRPER